MILSAQKRHSRFVSFAILLLFAPALLGITVFEQDIVCPICGTHNKVLAVGSWGSYACRPEGELDLVPCPIAYTGSFWSCSRCKFTSFIADAKIPPEKIDLIRRFLEALPGEIEVSRPGADPSWRPKVGDQLFVAQGVYQILGRDKVFWSDFYRVAGFFAAQEGKTQRAIGLRGKALRVTEDLLIDPARAAYRKQDLLAAGAMAAKLGNTTLARQYLSAVKSARYDPPGYEPSGLDQTREDMNELAKRILRSLR